jgi:hypothetical protein
MLTPNASPQYIWGTIYLYNGSAWVPEVISSQYLTTQTSYTIPASSLSSLKAGTYYLASWDWTWSPTQSCYLGPGSTSCNTGSWRVQQFSVTGGGGGGSNTCTSNCYYISPTGTDANSGTSVSAPWKTFAHAIPELQPGTTLVLENGTYNSSNSGFPSINCSSGDSNGTASRAITIQAQNERQAFIKGDGSTNPFNLKNCSYWNIIGLHIENGDFASQPNGDNSNMELNNDDHLVIRRNILARDNRYFNDHLINCYPSGSAIGCTNSLFEENEFYYFHRHAINVSYGYNNEFRRNYFNSRFYADIPGGRASELCCTTRGDVAISIYPDSNDFVENNVSEGNEAVVNITSGQNPVGGTGDENLANNNDIFGNLSLNDVYGYLQLARGSGNGNSTHNTVLDNNVFLNTDSGGSDGVSGEFGMNIRSPASGSSGTTVINNSMLSNNRSRFSSAAFSTDEDPSNTAGGSFEIHATNNLASIAVSASPGYGFSAAFDGGTWIGGFNFSNAFQNGINQDIQGGLANTNSKTSNPMLGSCYLWIPAGSPLKGAGSGGADIGATVLYEYQGGVLTGTPLWTATGAPAFAGAIVPGLNDVAGSSLFDVGGRLNINQNGCSFPTGY